MEPEACRHGRGEFTIDTSRDRLDLDVVHGFLSHSYWCPGIPRDVLERSIDHSLCFGLYERERQVGFARVVTDYARFAYLCDVFVLASYRGQGLGKWLVETVVTCPRLRGIRSMWLGTRDAHGLYERHGFRRPADPESMMQAVYPVPWHRPDWIVE